MAALPILFPFGQGAIVPQSFDKMLNSIKAADGRPQIFNGQPAPGLADALRTLRHNEFNSFFGSKNKYGMAEKHFDNKFQKFVKKPYVYTNMMVKEKNVTGPSKNGQHHMILFVCKLDGALQYTAHTCPTKYEEVLNQYVNSAKKASRTVKYS